MTDEAKAQLYAELGEMILKICGISSVFIIVCILLGIIISHRTAGPLFQFRKVFLEIKNGDLKKRIHLRPKDEFQDVAIAFNEMMDSISESKSK